MTDYFDEVKKERWRRVHPGFPEPQVWCRDATEAETPRAAALAFRRAQTVGWTSRLTYARGTHSDGNGDPAYHVNLVLLYDEGDNPVLTPTGKHACKEEKTDLPIIVESVVLRAEHEDGRWLRAVWERFLPRGREETKWKFAGAYTHQRTLKSNEITKVLLG